MVSFKAENEDKIMKRLLIATSNPGKFREYKIIFNFFLKEVKIDLVSLKELKIKEKIEEVGKDYKENAILKAKFYSRLSNLPTLADDSGLEIEVLGNWPGIKSRRVDGREAPDKELIKLVMAQLEGVPFKKRRAKYKAVIALALPSKNKIYTFTGERSGFIAKRSCKKIWKGFPFDSIFYLPEKREVFVRLSPREKAEFSHRLVGLRKALPILKQVFD